MLVNLTVFQQCGEYNERVVRQSGHVHSTSLRLPCGDVYGSGGELAPLSRSDVPDTADDGDDDRSRVGKCETVSK